MNAVHHWITDPLPLNFFAGIKCGGTYSDTTMHGGSPLNHVEETGEAPGSGMASGGRTTGTSGPTLTPAPVTGSKVTASKNVQIIASVMFCII
jgi:hypothetical protein